VSPGPAAVLAALRTRRAPHAPRAPRLLPLSGGAGALLRRSQSDWLVSVVDGDPAPLGGRSLRGRLERRQARRSALLLTPDRDTAWQVARRLGVDLARVRLASDLEGLAAEQAAALVEAFAGQRRRRAWHSR
jgi:hypothetical protein